MFALISSRISTWVRMKSDYFILFYHFSPFTPHVQSFTVKQRSTLQGHATGTSWTTLSVITSASGLGQNLPSILIFLPAFISHLTTTVYINILFSFLDNNQLILLFSSSSLSLFCRQSLELYDRPIQYFLDLSPCKVRLLSNSNSTSSITTRIKCKTELYIMKLISNVAKITQTPFMVII